jgi:hypothetical protein
MNNHEGNQSAGRPMAKLTARPPAAFAAVKFTKWFHAKVPNGGMSCDACAGPARPGAAIAPYLISVVKRLRLRPAHSNGKPIVGIAAIKPGQVGHPAGLHAAQDPIIP